MAGVSTGADFVFIPEKPPGNDWQDRMLSIIKKVRIGIRGSETFHFTGVPTMSWQLCVINSDFLLASESREAKNHSDRRGRRTRHGFE